jgi:DNA gyrase subunit B
MISGQRYQTDVSTTEDGEGLTARVSKWTHGIVSTEQYFNLDFFGSPEYQHFAALGQQLDGLLSAGAYIERGERQEPVSTFKQALDWLMAEARRGQHIQRYKGLGEMNPEQLWETTLDPESRRLLQVQIQDAVGSDDIFTTLMGDQVEPRRDFIEQNALAVSNLDV